VFHVSSSYKTVPLPVANRVCTEVISRRQAITFHQTAINCCGCIKLLCLLIIIFIFWFFVYHFVVLVVCFSVSVFQFYCHYVSVFRRTIDSNSDCAAPSLPFYRFIYTYSLRKTCNEYNKNETQRKVSEPAKVQRHSSEVTNKANYL
jgi:hypothetical protein